MGAFSRLAGLLGAGSLALAGLVMQATPASAADSVTASVKCQTSTFPAFDWTDFTIKASGTTDGTSTVLALQFSDLPGVVPLAVKGVPMEGLVKATVGGKPVEFTGVETIDVGARQPVKLPKVTARIAGGAPTADIVVTSHTWTVTAMGTAFPTVCPVSGSSNVELTDVPVTSGTLPTETPTPTTTPTPTPTPTEKPTATPTPPEEPGEGTDGKPAKGKVTFDCVLMPLTTEFEYAPTVEIAGARSEAGDTEVDLAATLTDIPGISPVQIPGHKMDVEVKGTFGGKAFTVTGDSVVNSAPNQPVPVPRLTGTMTSSEETAEVKVDSFAFDFEPDATGLVITADCTATKGAALGPMTVGIGDLEEPPPGNGGGDGNGGGGDTTTTLPRTGGADAMPVVALWALGLGVLGAGLLVWLPRQRRTAS